MSAARKELLRRRAAKQEQADAGASGAGAADAVRSQQQQQRDVADSLRRTTTAVQQELKRSGEIGQVLDADKTSLDRTNTLQEGVGGAAGESARRLSSIQRKRRMEVLGAFSGLCWFCACATYVLLTRFFKVHLRDLGYWLLVLLVLAGAAGWQLKLKFLG